MLDASVNIWKFSPDRGTPRMAMVDSAALSAVNAFSKASDHIKCSCAANIGAAC